MASPCRFDNTTASWTVDNHDRRLGQFVLRIYGDSSTMFLKLRILLNFSSTTEADHQYQVAAWLLIDPGWVDKLDFNTEAPSLRLTLRRVPKLIIPHNAIVHESSQEKWALLTSLAEQRSFLLSAPSMKTARLEPLCAAVSEGKLTTNQDAADIASFYNGKGGRVVTGEDNLNLAQKRQQVNADTSSRKKPRRMKLPAEEIEPQLVAGLRQELEDGHFPELAKPGKPGIEEILAKWKAKLEDLKHQERFEFFLEMKVVEDYVQMMGEEDKSRAHALTREVETLRAQLETQAEQIQTLQQLAESQAEQIKALQKQVEAPPEQVNTQKQDEAEQIKALHDLVKALQRRLDNMEDSVEDKVITRISQAGISVKLHLQ